MKELTGYPRYTLITNDSVLFKPVNPQAEGVIQSQALVDPICYRLDTVRQLPKAALQPWTGPTPYRRSRRLKTFLPDNTEPTDEKGGAEKASCHYPESAHKIFVEGETLKYIHSEFESVG